ncbi:MAG: hypothetical protein JSW12_08030 [Deltaproteobacteria bacterium]|nr:MAG: hypothetical protein JSW12_08030 [Deltaproteobacteria bacterium]
MTASAKERFLKELEIGSGKPRPVRAPRGAELLCKGWHQEGALRMLCNNLDPECGEKPDERPRRAERIRAGGDSL